MRYIAIYDAVEELANRYAQKGPELYQERMAPFLRAAQEYKAMTTAERKKYDSEYGLTVDKAQSDAKAADTRTPQQKQADMEKRLEDEARETFKANWLESVTQAVMSGKLRSFKPVTKAPSKPADAKEAYIYLVQDTDLNAWLKRKGSAYSLEEPASELSELQKMVWLRADEEWANNKLSGGGPLGNPEIVKRILKDFTARGKVGRDGMPYKEGNITRALKGWRKDRGHPEA